MAGEDRFHPILMQLRLRGGFTRITSPRRHKPPGRGHDRLRGIPQAGTDCRAMQAVGAGTVPFSSGQAGRDVRGLMLQPSRQTNCLRLDARAYKRSSGR